MLKHSQCNDPHTRLSPAPFTLGTNPECCDDCQGSDYNLLFAFLLPAVNATVWNPSDVKVDAAGNIYVADGQNRVIRRIDAKTGIINTIIGNGIKSSQQPSGDGGHPIQGQIGSSTTGGMIRVFLGPRDMFISDSANFAIRKVTLYQTLR